MALKSFKAFFLYVLALSHLQPCNTNLTAWFPQNDREFDPYDILANAVGSIAALLLCSWYHKRMLERKRRAKQYQVVPGEDVDVELGENVNEEGQESGVVREGMTVEEELDNWDENAEDNWDPEEPNGGAETEQAGKTDSAAAAAAEQSAKKRDD